MKRKEQHRVSARFVPGALGYLGVMLTIVAIDYALGPTAEYLNAYEIVRLSFARSLPMTCERYVIGQTELGRAALAVAWLLYLVEATLATALLKKLWSLVAG